MQKELMMKKLMKEQRRNCKRRGGRFGFKESKELRIKNKEGRRIKKEGRRKL